MPSLILKNRLAGAAACAMIAAMASPTLAQTEVPAASQAAGESDGEIVVTALRRSSTLQDAPLSIAAISGDGLAKMGATGLQDYFRAIPNLNLSQGQIGSSRISIRGINAAGEATVGLYFDEVPISGPSGTTQDAGNNAADLNLFDVERVEVLRGPQGTLYGSSSMAGTLRLIFNKPDASKREAAMESQISTTKGGSVGYFVKAMVNQPLIEDVLALRVSAYQEERPGYVDNVTYGTRNVNNGSSKGVRALLAFTPRPDMTLTGTAIYQQTRADDQQGWYEAVGRYQAQSQLQLPFNSKLQLYNLTYDWELPGVTLTATGSWYRYDILRSLDFTAPVNALSQSPAACRTYFALATGTPCSSAQLATYRNAGLASLPAIGYQPAHLKAKTAELRATSTGKGPFNWAIGAFYEKRDDYIDSHVSLASPLTGATYLPLQDLSYRYVATELTQKAAFGEVSLEPFQGLTLTAGARYYDYSKTTAGEATLASPLTASAITPYGAVTAKAKGWIEKFNVSYKFSRDVMVYATASKGFRPGGANNIPSLPGGLVVYAPDSLWNYEAGLKSSLFDNMVTFNLALFQIDWKDIQTSARTADGLFSFITNAGKARIRGGEADLTVRPAQGLSVTLAAGYSDAKLSEDQINSSLQVTGSTGLNGERLPNVPKWTASATASYSWPLFGDYDGLVRADYAYTGAMTNGFGPTTNPYYEAYGNYSSVNLRTGIERKDRGIYLFVQNLTNEVGLTGAASGLGYDRLVFSIAPRTIGINTRIGF
ncbi:MAG: TonB-dependent receptor [Sphingobium sp.]